MTVSTHLPRLPGPAPADPNPTPQFVTSRSQAAPVFVNTRTHVTPHITSVEMPATRPTTPLSAALLKPAMSALREQVRLTKRQASDLGKRINAMPPVTLVSHLEASERLTHALHEFRHREERPLVLTDTQHVELLERVLAAPGRALGLWGDLKRALTILDADRTHVIEVFAMLCGAPAMRRQWLCDLLQARLLEGLPAEDGPAFLQPLGRMQSEALSQLLFVARAVDSPPIARQVARLARKASLERLRDVASVVDLGLLDHTTPTQAAALVEACFHMSDTDMGVVMTWAEGLTSARAKHAIAVALVPQRTRTQLLTGLDEAREHGLLAGIGDAEEEQRLVFAWLALGPETAADLLQRCRSLEFAPNLADVILDPDPAASLMAHAEYAAQQARDEQLDAACEDFIAGADLPDGGTPLLVNLQHYLNDVRNFTPEMLSRLKQPYEDGRPVSYHLNEILTYLRREAPRPAERVAVSKPLKIWRTWAQAKRLPPRDPRKPLTRKQVEALPFMTGLAHLTAIAWSKIMMEPDASLRRAKACALLMALTAQKPIAHVLVAATLQAPGSGSASATHTRRSSVASPAS
jgi:hypothetical protein